MADWMILKPRRRFWSRVIDMRVSCIKIGTEDSEGCDTAEEIMTRNKRKAPRMGLQRRSTEGV